MIEPLDAAGTPAFCHLIPARLAIPNLLVLYKLQEATTFFMSDLIFSHFGPSLYPNKEQQQQKIIKTLTMADPKPPPRLPDLIPHEITKGEINITQAPQSSPICANNAPVANLFCNL
jgi:hypothetical protein